MKQALLIAAALLALAVAGCAQVDPQTGAISYVARLWGYGAWRIRVWLRKAADIRVRAAAANHLSTAWRRLLSMSAAMTRVAAPGRPGLFHGCMMTSALRRCENPYLRS